MIVMLGLALTTIYRNLRQLTGLALDASYLSDAVGSHSEIFWRLGHQIGRFLHVLHATSRGKKLRWLISAPFEPNALIRKKHNLSLSLLEG
jgi:hypothetical protein